MAKARKPDSGSGGVPKRTPAEVQSTIRSLDTEVQAAIEAVLRKSGLHHVQIHSVNYLVDPGGMSSSGCDNCDLTWNDCVLTPQGFICKPKS